MLAVGLGPRNARIALSDHHSGILLVPEEELGIYPATQMSRRIECWPSLCRLMLLERMAS